MSSIDSNCYQKKVIGNYSKSSSPVIHYRVMKKISEKKIEIYKNKDYHKSESWSSIEDYNNSVNLNISSTCEWLDNLFER